MRAVVLAGAGRMFCGGGDLKAFATKGDALPHYLKDVTTYLHAAVSRLTRMDAPVIAAVHGSAAGAGMSLACAADFVLAADTSKFTMAYTPGGPDARRLVDLLPVAHRRPAPRARPGSDQPRADGLRSAGARHRHARRTGGEACSTKPRRLAADVRRGPTRALGETKRLLHAGWTGTLETQMELETRAIADIARGHDAREGIAAFAEKRAAKFVGR